MAKTTKKSSRLVFVSFGVYVNGKTPAAAKRAARRVIENGLDCTTQLRIGNAFTQAEYKNRAGRKGGGRGMTGRGR